MKMTRYELEDFESPAPADSLPPTSYLHLPPACPSPVFSEYEPPEAKETNPKDAVGTKKAPLSCVPAPVLLELGLAMLEGARKYGRHNYRAVGVRASVYYDAAMRHLMAWWEGEDLDPDSGVSHVTKAMACLAVLRDAQMLRMVEDDRPPPSREGWLTDLNVAAGKVVERYDDSGVRHYTRRDEP